MATRSRRHVLGIALVLGLMAAGLTAYYMTNITQAANPKERVVVAKANIPARTILTEDLLTVADLPRGARHPESANTMEPFIGKVTKRSVTAREQVLATDVFRNAAQAGLAPVIPPGSRAVAVSVDEHTGAGGLIAAGDRVDILAVCNVPGSERSSATLTKTLYALQRIEVLAVAQKVVGEEAGQPLDALRSKSNGAALSASRQPATQATARTITLALTPQQAQAVVMLEENAECSIRMALRSPDDSEKTTLPETVFNPLQPLAGQVQY